MKEKDKREMKQEWKKCASHSQRIAHTSIEIGAKSMRMAEFERSK